MAAKDDETSPLVTPCMRGRITRGAALTPEDHKMIRDFGRFLRIGHQAQSAVLFPTAECADVMQTDLWTRYIDHMERGLALIRNMPDMTLEDRITRLVAFARHNAAFDPGETSEGTDP